MYGELVPIGGGDPIPLRKKALLVGRRESCDIVLRFSNVSAHHCQLSVQNGYWFVKDLKSRNGIKVNGVRVHEKRLDPGCELSIAKHRYEVRYDPSDVGAIGPPDEPTAGEQVLQQGLLDRSGLETAAGKRYRESLLSRKEMDLIRGRPASRTEEKASSADSHEDRPTEEPPSA